MQKRFLILTSLSILLLLLAACGSAGDQDTGNQGTGVPPLSGTGTAIIPETGQTAQVTVMPTGTGTTAQPLETTTPSGTGTAATPTGAATSAPVETLSATGMASETSQAPSGQVSTPGVIGIPGTGSGKIAGLADMIGFRVVDARGNDIGTVEDYVINMCEAHILYLVVRPADGVDAGNNQVLLIPYEAILKDINQGGVDAGQRVFMINIDSAALGDVPAVDFETLDLQTPNWDRDLMTYWKKQFQLSLTSGCSVPVNNNAAASTATVQPGTPGTGTAAPTALPVVTGTPGADTTPDSSATASATQPAGEQATTAPTIVPGTGNPSRQLIQRLALANRLLTAKLQDGNSKVIGSVRDVAIIPETGRTHFLVIQREQGDQAGNGLVALPPGAVNVQYPDNASQPTLVLLVDPGVFYSAPAFNLNASPFDANWFNYWQQYIPMTREQMP